MQSKQERQIKGEVSYAENRCLVCITAIDFNMARANTLESETPDAKAENQSPRPQAGKSAQALVDISTNLHQFYCASAVPMRTLPPSSFRPQGFGFVNLAYQLLFCFVWCTCASMCIY